VTDDVPMNSPAMSDPAPVAATSSVRDFITLMKPGVMSLVVFTGLAGMVVAQRLGAGHLNLFQQAVTLMCIALASGAGAAVNMWYDRDIDAIMKRTMARPIPAGRVTPDDGLAFGLFLSAFSVMMMGLALNWVAALVLGSAIGFYVLIYTMWLKRSTPQNIVIGGAAGSFPPMIGWAAVSGDVTLYPVLLFTIIFLWTPPHFWALALYKNEDYTRAGVPMMPVVAGAKATKRQMIIYTYLLAISTLLPVPLGFASLGYGAVALVLAVMFLHHVHKTYYDTTDRWARKTFGFSILYLFVLFTAIMLDAYLSTLHAS
jgi:heme o synthase